MVLRVVIDDEVVIDGDMGDWTADPPQILRDQLTADTTPKPWMRCLLMVIAAAALTGADTAVAVSTRDDGWTLEVTEQ